MLPQYLLYPAVEEAMAKGHLLMFRTDPVVFPEYPLSGIG